MNTVLDRLGSTALRTYVTATSDLDTLRERRLAWVWVFFAILIMVAAAIAFVMCVNKGYRGFSGNWRFHTVWRVPVGIDLGCY